jgi:hypothetical protein
MQLEASPDLYFSVSYNRNTSTETSVVEWWFSAVTSLLMTLCVGWRWPGSDDIITHDIHMYMYNTKRKAEWIFMEFGMDILPSDSTWKLYFLINCVFFLHPFVCTNVWR